VKELSKVVKYECYQPNEVIFHYGEPGKKFYMIMEGKVSVVV
jgi:CRP-like cAMP-binding protein